MRITCMGYQQHTFGMGGHCANKTMHAGGARWAGVQTKERGNIYPNDLCVSAAGFPHFPPMTATLVYPYR